ncbi:MAG: PQQ-binding-like beta-propeller repeat protein, partial [bacterium]
MRRSLIAACLLGVVLVVVGFALSPGSLASDSTKPNNNAQFTLTALNLVASATDAPIAERLANVTFGPVDAVDEEVDELQKKANKHWKGIWQEECNDGENTEASCSGDGSRIPDRVWTYWQNNPGKSPSGFNAIAATIHTDDGATESDTVATTRDPLWTISTGGPISAAPAVNTVGDTVYVGSHDNNLYMVDMNDTSNVETYSTNGAIQSSPTIGPGNKIYFGSRDQHLYALNPDGTPAWSEELDDWILASPAVDAAGNVYVGTVEGTLYSYTSDGTKRWSKSYGNKITSSPALTTSGNYLYVGSWDGNLYKVKTSGGTQQWSHSTDGAIKSSPALDASGNIYFGSSDNSVYSVSPTNTLRWDTPTNGAVRSSPVLDGSGHVYVGSSDHKLYKFSQTEGSKIWEFQTSREILATPIGADNGRVSVGSRDGDLYTIKSDGTGDWKTQTGEGIVSSATGADTDGIAPSIGFFGSNDGNLYAVKSDANDIATTPWPKFQRTVKNSGSAVGGVPLVSITSPSNGADTNASPITVKGTSVNADAGDSVEMLVNGTFTDTAIVQSGGSWSASDVSLSTNSDSVVARLHQSDLASPVSDTAQITVSYDTQIIIDTATVLVSDGTDTVGYSQLGGDTVLREGTDITHRITVRDADTVALYYNRQGQTPTLSDTAVPMSNITADTWEGVIPSTDLSDGDTVSFLIEASDAATNTDTDARTDTGYRYQYDQPLYAGPVWYINDDDTSGDVYSDTAGNDAYNGSSMFPFRTVQKGINKANAGDTIKIDVGTYSETANITSDSLTLTGVSASATIIDHGDSSAATEAVAIAADTQSGLLVQNLRVKNAYQGIRFNNTEKSYILNVVAEQNGAHGVVLADESGGAMLGGVAGDTLTSVTADNNDSGGLNLVASHGNFIYNSAFSQNRFGVGLRKGSSQNEFLSNKILNNGGATGGGGILAVDNSSQNVISNNIIKGNEAEAVGLYESDTNVLRRNIIRNNAGHGVFLSGSLTQDHAYDNIIGRNTITKNKHGVTVNPNTKRNLIGLNKIASNVNQLSIKDTNAVFGDTIGKNNILAGSDTLVRTRSGIPPVALAKNWLGRTDISVIKSKITGGGSDAVSFVPYRLGKIDTGVGADTYAPERTDIVSIAAGDGTAALEWSTVQLNQNGNSIGDFGEYRVYRDSRPMLTDWKDSATVVARITDRLDTDFVDSTVSNGDTYYYRVTATDTPSLGGGDGVAQFENEAFFSDTSAARPANDGPTWYVNDTFDGGEVFTTATGSDDNTGGQNDPFRTISHAMTVIKRGDTVKVDVGTYAETAAISRRNVTIQGADSTPTGTVIDVGDSSSATGAIALKSETDGAVIRNLRVKNSFVGAGFGDAKNSMIKNVAAVHNKIGLALDHLATADTIVGSYAADNDSNGINVEGSQNTVRRNVTVNNGLHGIQVATTETGYSADTNTIKRNVIRQTGNSGLYFYNAMYNRVIENRITNNPGGGIKVDQDAYANRMVRNYVADNTPGLILANTLGPEPENYAGSNEFASNEPQVYINSPSSKPDFGGEKINLVQSDSYIYVEALGDSLGAEDEWWGTTNREKLRAGVGGPDADSFVFNEFRLGVVDTGVNADTVEPERTDIVSIEAGDGTAALEWRTVDQNENGNSIGDFAEYRVYRDSRPMLSDWKDSATVVATVTDRLTTGVVDSSVSNGDTYYYRVTAVDNPTSDGGDGVADVENEAYFSDTSAAHPAYNGPTWYVNDTYDGGEEFTTVAGNDAYQGSSDSPFRTVSHAMTRVEQGDTVKVDVGTYGETVSIPVDGLALVGADSTSTVLNYGDSTAATAARGIYADTQVNLDVEHLQVTKSFVGIEFRNVDQSSLEHVQAVSNGDEGILLTGQEAADGSQFNYVAYNKVSNNSGDGLKIYDGSTGNVIAKNVSVDNGINGIGVSLSSSSNTIQHNATMANGQAGIDIISSTFNTIRNNTTKFNDSYGIRLVNSADNNDVYQNEIVSNGTYQVKIDNFSSIDLFAKNNIAPISTAVSNDVVNYRPHPTGTY